MRIVVLTGAGISAESGLTTFRDSGGLWEGHDPMQVATPEAYADDPGLVQRFYDARRAALSQVEPNAAHHALVRLEDALGDDLLVVTRNVDDLHERAGSRRGTHPRAAAVGLVHALRRAPRVERRAGGPTRLSLVRRGRPSSRHRVVRRDPLRHGPRRAGAGGVRPLRLDRHVGRRLPGRGVRPLGSWRHPRARPRAQRRRHRLRRVPSGSGRPSCPPGSTSCSPDFPVRLRPAAGPWCDRPAQDEGTPCERSGAWQRPSRWPQPSAAAACTTTSPPATSPAGRRGDRRCRRRGDAGRDEPAPDRPGQGRGRAVLRRPQRGPGGPVHRDPPNRRQPPRRPSAR